MPENDEEFEVDFQEEQAGDFDTLYGRWDEYFEKFNWNNPLYHKLLFHVLVGQLFKKIKINKAGVELDGRISVMLIQDQGTGKNTPFTPFKRICDLIDKELSGSNPKIGELKCNRLDEFSDAATIGTTRQIIDELGRTVFQTVPGYFSENKSDIIMIKEAKSILDSYNRDSKIVQYINLALEPIHSETIITKVLVTGIVECKSSASFLMTTYPTSEINTDILASGLFRRLLVYYNKISLSEKKANIMKGFSNLHTTQAETEQFDSLGLNDEKLIASQLIALYLSNPEEDLYFNIDKKIIPKIQNFINKYMNNAAKLPNEIMQVYSSIISSYSDYSIVIASHRALLFKRKEINIEDIEYSLEIMDDVVSKLLGFIVWVYTNNASKSKAEGYQNEYDFNKEAIKLITASEMQGKPIKKDELVLKLKVMAKGGKFGFSGDSTVYRKVGSLFKQKILGIDKNGYVKTLI